MSIKNVVRLTCVLVVMGWAATATAQPYKQYSLSGDGGFWIGGGLPIPVTKGLPPNQALKATPNATVLQTLGPDPKGMVLKPSQMTKPLGRSFAGQFPNNPKLMQVSTTLSFKFPAAAGLGATTTKIPPFPGAPGNAALVAGGRTGPPTLTWCPGWPATNPPTCTNPNTKGIAGMLTYKKTVAQFGGPAQGSVAGRATIFGVAGSPAPCKHPAFGGTNAGCLAAAGYATFTKGRELVLPPGAPFGFYNTTKPVQMPTNVYAISANANGSIGARLKVAYAPFVNSATSYGGPWTTGQLTVLQTAAYGATETFTLTGGDNRVNGIGNISLVAGAVSQRAASGPNANRAWLNLQVGAKTPALPGLAIAGLAVLLAGGGISLARRKK